MNHRSPSVNRRGGGEHCQSGKRRGETYEGFGSSFIGRDEYKYEERDRLNVASEPDSDADRVDRGTEFPAARDRVWVRAVDCLREGNDGDHVIDLVSERIPTRGKGKAQSERERHEPRCELSGETRSRTQAADTSKKKAWQQRVRMS